MKIKIFIDGPQLSKLNRINKHHLVSGFTTNPTLISKMNVSYVSYVKQFLKTVKYKSSSFEVLADKDLDMVDEAKIISNWGKNIYVKIPVVNTKGKSTSRVIKNLSDQGIKLNITAIFTKKQMDVVKRNIKKESDAIISIFCGRIADTGRDPIPYIKYAKKIFKEYKNVKILWASPREVLNIFQADLAGCDIITVTEDLFKKLSLQKKNLTKFSIETVKMFYNDAKKSNLKVNEF